MNMLATGDIAPSFTLENAAGETISLESFKGTKTILYFYPQASTPGCTNQACDFRDNINSLSDHDYKVVGISPDTRAKIARFIENESLNFELLADPDHRVAEIYGVWGEKKNYGKTYIGLIRSTFVIDEEGKILLAQYNVRAKGHVAKLRRDLGIDS